MVPHPKGSSARIYLKTNELLSDTQNYIKYILIFQIKPNSMMKIEHIYIYIVFKIFLAEGGGCENPHITHVSRHLPTGKQAEMESRLN